MVGAILELYSGSGNWSEPYERAGYKVLRFDLKSGVDVRLLTKFKEPIHGILAGPPCTHLSASGAWMWKKKGDAALLEALSTVDAVYRLVAVHQPAWWALENPVGRLKDFLGPPVMWFDPCDYGGYLNPPGDAYTKKTGLWGNFTKPTPKPVAPTQGSKMLALPPSKARAALRSVTPMGFAEAFFQANP